MSAKPSPAAKPAGNGNNNTAHRPLIFQCSKCLQIFGDSLAWISSSTKLRAFTLSATVKGAVNVSNELLTSSQGEDLGSAYYNIECSKCKTNLGRYYKTTPRNLDAIRDLNTFFTEHIVSFRLGSGQPSSAASTKADFFILNPTPDEVSTRFAMLETMMIGFHEELEHVVKALNQLYTEIPKTFADQLEGLVQKLASEGKLLDHVKEQELQELLEKSKQPAALPAAPTGSNSATTTGTKSSSSAQSGATTPSQPAVTVTVPEPTVQPIPGTEGFRGTPVAEKPVDSASLKSVKSPVGSKSPQKPATVISAPQVVPTGSQKAAGSSPTKSGGADSAFFGMASSIKPASEPVELYVDAEASADGPEQKKRKLDEKTSS